jgi:cytochrome c oxidase subunit 3
VSAPAESLLSEPWPDLERQRRAAAFGIWIFLASELLFFGGLLLVYTVARILHPAAFMEAARETDILYGTANTAVLLTSSLTMALAAEGAEAGSAPRVIRILLAATAALGCVFLATKGLEYLEDLDKGLWPAAGFALAAPGARLFFALYWLLTGVHGLHLIVGIGLVTRLCVIGGRGGTPLRGSPQLQVTALYWHLVDIIWVILYPLIYLPGRSG